MIRFVASDPRFDGGCSACKSNCATRALEVGLDRREGETQYVTTLRFCIACSLLLAEVAAGEVGVGLRRGR